MVSRELFLTEFEQQAGFAKLLLLSSILNVKFFFLLLFRSFSRLALTRSGASRLRVRLVVSPCQGTSPPTYKTSFPAVFGGRHS